MSDARRLKVDEQAQADLGEETAEFLMELVVLPTRTRHQCGHRAARRTHG
jgi:hypothetical protein